MRDDTTRFRCGAAHHDQECTDSAIHRYPMQAARPDPRPPPGVNVGAEVVRTWRGVCDSKPSAATGPFVGNGTLLALPQLLVLAAGVWFRGGQRVRRGSPHGSLVLGSAASAIAPIFVPCAFTGERCRSGSCYARFKPVRGDAGLAIGNKARITGAGRAHTGTTKVGTSKENP
ncbi:hypothetical protein GCM10022267_65690 [Lentzea roselyniae]|uniref:Uncharacterized protein n=1 Tax=Lentzea roselyniae TaxID=531940 RepID=A0ABP7BV57_9PSEU